MHSMKANEGSWNFMEKTMSNRVPALTPEDDPILFETFHRKLIEGSKCPYAMAVGLIGDKGNDGEWIEPRCSPHIPYELQFES